MSSSSSSCESSWLSSSSVGSYELPMCGFSSSSSSSATMMENHGTNFDPCPPGSVCASVSDEHFQKQTDWVYIVIGVGGGVMLLGFIIFVALASYFKWHKSWFAPSPPQSQSTGGARRHRRHRPHKSKRFASKRRHHHRHASHGAEVAGAGKVAVTEEESLPFGKPHTDRAVVDGYKPNDPFNMVDCTNGWTVVSIPPDGADLADAASPSMLRICVGIVEGEVQRDGAQGSSEDASRANAGNSVPVLLDCVMVRRPDGKQALIPKCQLRLGAPQTAADLYGRAVYLERDSESLAECSMSVLSRSGREDPSMQIGSFPVDPSEMTPEALASARLPEVDYDLLCDSANGFEYTLGDVGVAPNDVTATIHVDVESSYDGSEVDDSHRGGEESEMYDDVEFAVVGTPVSRASTHAPQPSLPPSYPQDNYSVAK